MNKNKEEMLVFEYKLLREEINALSTRHNHLVLFAITTTITIVGAALIREFSYPHFVLLFTLFFLALISVRISYSRRSVFKISAYMILFLEKELNGVNWQSALSAYDDPNPECDEKDIAANQKNGETKEKESKRSWKDIPSRLRYYECFVLSLFVSFFLYYHLVFVDIVLLIHGDTSILISNLIRALFVLLSLTIVIFIFIVTRMTKIKIDPKRKLHLRQYWIKEWERKYKENGDTWKKDR